MLRAPLVEHRCHVASLDPEDLGQAGRPPAIRRFARLSRAGRSPIVEDFAQELDRDLELLKPPKILTVLDRFRGHFEFDGEHRRHRHRG